MENIKKSYYDKTYNAKNPLRRFAHRARFKNGIKSIHIKNDLNILDFGCGDGLFLNLLKNSTDETLNLVGFEPYMEEPKSNSIDIYKNWEEIEDLTNRNSAFDYVTCFEVMEHFCSEKQKEVLLMIKNILKNDGTVILSVPIEIGIPAVVKNIVRRKGLRKAKHIYSYKNIKASLLGRPLPEFRECGNYLSHMGFYFKDLEKLILEIFIIENKFYSPIKGFGFNFNSQVFYNLKLRNG